MENINSSQGKAFKHKSQHFYIIATNTLFAMNRNKQHLTSIIESI